jgi:hypothetical protein
MGKNERRRRVRVVYRSLQYYFLAQFFIYSAIIVFFLAVFLFVPDMLKMQNENLSVSERTSAADRVITLHVKVWPAALALIALLGLHSFLTFHRLSGPLYRFRTIFNQMREGRLAYPIKIRRGDFLHSEEEALNEMLDVWTDKLQNIQQAGHEALNFLRDLERRLEDRQDLKPLADRLDRLIGEAGYFKVDRR